MKRKLISYCLAFVMMLSSVICVQAEQPPYLKSFANKDDMLLSLYEYSESFPDVEDYSNSDLKADRPGMHVEYKKVIVPAITDNAYIASTYEYAETTYGFGVDYTYICFVGYNDSIRVITYYQMNEKQIEENLSDHQNTDSANVHNGTVNSIDYSAVETQSDGGIVQCVYKLALDNKLVMVHTEKAFNSKFLEKIKFEATDVTLPVFVDNSDGCYRKYEDGDCINPDHNHPQVSVKDAIAQYEKDTGEKVDTNRYYFLMPDGKSGQKNPYENDKDNYNTYPQSWYNEYTAQPAIYWENSGVSDPEDYPGYKVEKGDCENIYYADVPTAVYAIVWNNGIEYPDNTHNGFSDPMHYYAMKTINVPCEYYDADESETYPEGLYSFDNMIYVTHAPTISTDMIPNSTNEFIGEWYYYYGDGCYGIVENGSTDNCIRDDHNHKKPQLSVKEALAQYEAQTGEKLDTNRYYFLMPNGKNGELGDDDTKDENGNYFDTYSQYTPSWYNEYTNEPAIYWWRRENPMSYDPMIFPGYTVEKGDSDSVFYADVPKNVTTIIWSNNVHVSFDTGFDPMYQYLKHTFDICCEYYDAGESENYPNGTESFDNMIYVIDPDSILINDDMGEPDYAGEWYYYYGDGCYGTVQNGTSDNCIRDDHSHPIDYAEEFEKYLLTLGYTTDHIAEGYWIYNPLYSYYTKDIDTVPAYIMTKGGFNHSNDASNYGVFGDYYMIDGDYSPYELGYYIYVTSERKYYTLSEAWDAKIKGIEKVFEDYFVSKNYAFVIGDEDGDGELSILDATGIQMALASLREFSSDKIFEYSTCVYGDQLIYASDVDRDGERSILDATAIQLKLAKLD